MSITHLLNIKYPIFQGAMAQISRYPLAAAVSKAGGLGILTSSGMDAQTLRNEIRQLRQLTTNPFAVNLMLKMSNITELVQVIIEEKVPIVTTGAGTPKYILPLLKEANIKVIPVIASVKHALKMQELGADAIIAEGTESGGHIGETTTMALIPQVVDAVNIPVIAAGGIADGRGIVAAFALGAQGVQLGTAFLAAEECPIPFNYKEAIINAIDTSTAVTGRTNGAPVRCIRNEMTDTYLKLEYSGAPYEQLEKVARGALQRAVKDGDVTNSSLMAGQIAGLVKIIQPAKVIIENLIKDANQVANQINNIF